MEQLPEFKSRGNLHLLEEPLTAFFCSAQCPGDLILKTYDLARSMRDAGVAVIGGFQTPMERECLRLLLRGNQPVVICPARSVENMRIPRDWPPALEEERLLILSRFPRHQRRPTTEVSEQRNDLVANLANQVFIAHAALGGRTEAFARKLAAVGKPLLTLDSPANKNLVDRGSPGVRPGMMSVPLFVAYDADDTERWWEYPEQGCCPPEVEWSQTLGTLTAVF